MPTEPIRMDEWLCELEQLRAKQGDDGAFTVADVMNAMGLSHTDHSKQKARGMIRAGIASGRIEVTRKSVVRLDGNETTIAAYRLTKRYPQAMAGKRGGKSDKKGRRKS